MLKVTGFLFVFLLFLNISAWLGLDASLTSFVNSNHVELIVLMLLLLSALSMPIVESVLKTLGLMLNERMEGKRFLARARQLNPSDKYIISLFVDDKKLFCSLDPFEPSVAWLESIKIIQRSGNAVDDRKATYRITPLAMDYFTKNPNLLR